MFIRAFPSGRALKDANDVCILWSDQIPSHYQIKRLFSDVFIGLFWSKKKNRINHLMNLKSKKGRNVTFCIRTNGQRRENEVSLGGCSFLPGWLCWQAAVAKHGVTQGTPCASHILSLAASMPMSLQWFKASESHFSSRVCAQPSLWYSIVQGHLTMVLKYSNVLNCLSISGPMNPKFSFAQ